MGLNKGKVLLVEDEESIHEAVKMNLELEGFQVCSAFDGADVMKLYFEFNPDIVLLDIMLPHVDGYKLCEMIKKENSSLPVIILSAKGAGEDRVKGLRIGADDYLAKPFNLEELLLRVERLVDKSRSREEKEFSFGENTVYINEYVAINFSGERIKLSDKEIRLLQLFSENKGKVVPRDEIIEKVWGEDSFPTTRTVDNFILNFRKYFERDSKNPVYFQSIRGVGYKFDY